MKKLILLAVFAAAPICAYSQEPCSMHDPTQWHGLVANQANPSCPCLPAECSYNHEHGDDPSGISAFGGQWPAIPNTAEAHQLWKYHVRTDLAPQGEGELYVRNLIFLAHVAGINKAMEVRFHGTVTWAELCHKTTGQCGVLKQRAATDFGCLQVETTEGLLTAPNFGQCGGGRRVHYRRSDAPWLDSVFVWYGNQGIYNEPEPGNRVFLATVGPAVRGSDAFSGRDPADWDTWLWNCPELAYCAGAGCQPDPSTVDVSGCAYNGTHRGVEVMLFTIFREEDAGGFTDASGRVDPSCLSETGACLPFSLEGLPAGFAAYRPGDGREYDNFLGLVGFPN